MRKSTLDRKVFIFSLDAFLSTSRSVTFVLQKEFADNPKFQSWYGQKRDEMKKDPLMKFFVDMRDVSIHERSPQTEAVVTTSFTETLSISDSVSLTLTHPNGTKEVFEPKHSDAQGEQPTPKESPAVQCYYFFSQNNDNDVVSLCAQYYEKLFYLVMQAKIILAPATVP
jgi:hypothetical protein